MIEEDSCDGRSAAMMSCDRKSHWKHQTSRREFGPMQYFLHQPGSIHILWTGGGMTFRRCWFYRSWNAWKAWSAMPCIFHGMVTPWFQWTDDLFVTVTIALFATSWRKVGVGKTRKAGHVSDEVEEFTHTEDNIRIDFSFIHLWLCGNKLSLGFCPFAWGSDHDTDKHGMLERSVGTE